jgi:twinkle protein
MVKHNLRCPECGSKKALSDYEENKYCHSCGHYERKGDTMPENAEVSETKTKLPLTPLPPKFRPLVDRNISALAAERFKVGVYPNAESHGKLYCFPYFTPEGHHVANKIKKTDGTYYIEGDLEQAGLFGQHLFPPGSAKAITLVEGECDALAAWEMTGHRYPVASITRGADYAAEDCVAAFEYLNSFDSIVICFDKDEPKVNKRTGAIRYPGQEAAQAVANLFPIGKVRILTLREAKDANDYLKMKKSAEFVKEWFQAPVYTPAGLKVGKDMLDEILTERKYESILYPFPELNTQTYGARLSELVLITADTGVGKTQFLKEIEYSILTTTEYGVGFLHLEEPNRDTALGLLSVHNSKPYHLPDTPRTKEELQEAFNIVLNNDRVVIWDHFGSNNIHEVLAKIRHMHNLGCKFIFLDHLSIVVSDQSGDERKQLDEISTKLKMLCMELNINVHAVIHQNRNGQIRSSAGPEQLANIVIKLTRDKTDPDPWRRNVTEVLIEKNRFCGRTGPATMLWYNEFTSRLSQLSEEEQKAFREGLNNAEAF